MIARRIWNSCQPGLVGVKSVVVKLNSTPFEFVENSWQVLQFCKWPQLLSNVIPIKLTSLPHNHSFYIDPILAPCCESFEYDQILGCTSSQRDIWRVFKECGPLNHQF